MTEETQGNERRRMSGMEKAILGAGFLLASAGLAVVPLALNQESPAYYLAWSATAMVVGNVMAIVLPHYYSN